MKRLSVALASVPAFAAIVACGHAAMHDRPAVATDPAFASNARAIRSIDIAPFDLTLALGEGANAQPAQLQATAVAELANATIAALDHRAYRLDALLERDGDATSRADATLFVSGWSFVAAPRPPRANRVADTIGRGVARAVGTAVELTAFALTDTCPPVFIGSTDETADLTRREASAQDEPLLPETGPSQLYLAMTLVDNHTGATLWHAHHQFAANAARPREVRHAAEALLASLPRR